MLFLTFSLLSLPKKVIMVSLILGGGDIAKLSSCFETSVKEFF